MARPKLAAVNAAPLPTHVSELHGLRLQNKLLALNAARNAFYEAQRQAVQLEGEYKELLADMAKRYRFHAEQDNVHFTDWHIERKPQGD